MGYAAGAIERVGAAARAGAPEPASLLDRGAILAGAGAWSCDLATSRLRWTAGVYAMFGFDPGHPVARHEALARYDEESRDVLERVRGEALARRTIFSLECRLVPPGVAPRWIRITAKVERGELLGWKQDITRERAAWDTLRQMAEQDALTGLANRGMFQRAFLDEGLDIHAATTLVLFDVDGFKAVNDGHGHAAGDACLVAVARHLRATFGEAALIARIGGDEFAVVTSAIEPADVVARVRQLLRRIATPVAWQGHLLRVSASAGMARATPPLSSEALFATADAALYRAKRTGRDRLCIAGARA